MISVCTRVNSGALFSVKYYSVSSSNVSFFLIIFPNFPGKLSSWSQERNTLIAMPEPDSLDNCKEKVPITVELDTISTLTKDSREPLPTCAM